jgi:ATP-dependent DNA helicase
MTVERSLPKKREYILYAPLTAEQSELYQSILDKDIRSYLENKHLAIASSSGTVTPRKRKSASPDEDEDSMASTPKTRSGASTPMSRTSSRSARKRARLSYKEMTDVEWFEAMEKAEREQFKEEHIPSHEIKHVSTRIRHARSIVDYRKIHWESEFTEYDNATSKGCESSLFI